MKIFKISPLLWLAALILAALLGGCNKKNPAPGSKAYYASLEEYYNIGCDGDYIPEHFAYAEALRDLGEKLLHDKATFDQDLSAELDSLDIKMTSSPDGKLKIYTWHDGYEGTMVCHNSIYQTYRNGEFYASFMEDFDEVPLHIWQVKSAKGPVYLVHFFFQESSSMIALGVSSFVLDGKGQLKPTEVFEWDNETHKTAEGLSDCIYTEKYLQLPPSADCKGGWADNFFFNESGKDLYLPYFFKQWEPYADEAMHDYYHHFEWNGEKFRYLNLKYNPILGKYLDEAGWLTIEFEVGKSIVRIDKTVDDTYRYIAWKKDKMFYAPPDLIITDGWYHEVDHLFHFVNKDHEYVFNTLDNHLHIYQTDPQRGIRREIANYEIEDVYSNL